MEIFDSVVIGGGQAGLSSSYHLKKRGIEHVLLDSNPRPGGAWQHRWDALTMSDVHRVSDLPDDPIPDAADTERANAFVPAYFTDYERTHDLPVIRPVQVRSVRDDDGLLRIDADHGTWLSRTLINATGTWTRPFIPYYPGAETFAGEQLHTVDYPGPEHFRGKRVLVVGGGASAVQFLGALRPITDTIWVTRREPVWRTDEFTAEIGREVVAKVEERVRQGLPPRSVVSVTGLMLRPQEREAERLGAYERRPMFSRIEPDGVRWADGHVRARRRDPLGDRIPARRSSTSARCTCAARAAASSSTGRPRSPTRASRWSATGRPRARSAPTAPALSGARRRDVAGVRSGRQLA